MLLSIPVQEDFRAEMAKLWVDSTRPEASERQKQVSVHKHRKAWEDVREQDGAKRYVLKYALKPYQKKVPKDYQDVGRFWGCSRDVSRSANELQWYTDATDFDARLLCGALGRDMSNWDYLPRDIFLPVDNDTGDSV